MCTSYWIRLTHRSSSINIFHRLNKFLLSYMSMPMYMSMSISMIINPYYSSMHHVFWVDEVWAPNQFNSWMLRRLWRIQSTAITDIDCIIEHGYSQPLSVSRWAQRCWHLPLSALSERTAILSLSRWSHCFLVEVRGRCLFFVFITESSLSNGVQQKLIDWCQTGLEWIVYWRCPEAVFWNE